MSRVRVKICGITRRTDAEAAVRLGADAIGFVFWTPSPRAAQEDEAKQIVRAMPALVSCVGVFVDEPPASVATVVDAVGLDAVQLHGDEKVEAYTAVGARLLRRAALSSERDVDEVARWPSDVTVLVDADDPRRRGGTGRTADWRLAALLAARRPVILAGGLTPETVGEALVAVRPWGVDVSSGVEAAPGVKDEGRMAAFIDAVAAGREPS